MRRAAIVAVSLVVLPWAASGEASETPGFTPCDDRPAAVLALGVSSEIDVYAVDSASSIAVAALIGETGASGSVLRVVAPGRAPKDVKLDGRAVGVALAPDGSVAFAIVRLSTRKGEVRAARLARIDLETGRVTDGPTIPTTARGLAIGEGGSTLLVAARDELRTFQLPSLSSGPLYRALGDNVGVAPIPGSTIVLLAQPTRVVLADLAGSQGRDGLALSQEAAAPAPLRGLLASAGVAGPIALGDGGKAWCVIASAPQPEPSPPPPPPPDEASPENSAAAELAPPPPPPPKASDEPARVDEPAPEIAQDRETLTQPPLTVPELPRSSGMDPPPIVPATGGRGEPSTLFGRVEGPAMDDVGAIVFLGPDNVLREAARAVPSGAGDFVSPALPPGGYRVVAAGKGGRVLICQPPFITARVDSKSALELPVLKVIRAQ